MPWRFYMVYRDPQSHGTAAPAAPLLDPQGTASRHGRPDAEVEMEDPMPRDKKKRPKRPKK